MKLMAYRSYKHDISDIIGILIEHQQLGRPLTFDMIHRAVNDLYGGWHTLPDGAQERLQTILGSSDLASLYHAFSKGEETAREALMIFEQRYPHTLQEDNLQDVLSHLLSRMKDE